MRRPSGMVMLLMSCASPDASVPTAAMRSLRALLREMDLIFLNHVLELLLRGDIGEDRRQASVVHRVHLQHEPPLPWFVIVLYLDRDTLGHYSAHDGFHLRSHRIGKHVVPPQAQQLLSIHDDALGFAVHIGETPGRV